LNVLRELPKSGARLLISFTAGRDTSAAFVKAASETSNELFTHHVSYRYEGDGWRAEDEAVKKLVPILQERYRPFTHSESIVDIDCKWIGTRYSVVHFVLAKVALANRCSFIVMGRKRADHGNTHPWIFQQQDENLRQHIQNELLVAKTPLDPAIMNMIIVGEHWVQASQDYTITTCYPLYDWSFGQVKGYLGDLLPLTWSCFFPVKKDGEWVPCHDARKCPSCRTNDMRY
jgi:7-cyano-7-deazaguanine synthase in queuosine biosynthesis